MTLTPPIANKHPHSITQHGQTRIDDYFWLRERDNPDTTAYLKTENAYLEEILGHTAALQEQLFQEMKGRIPESDASAPLRRGNFFYYTRMEPGKQYPIYCRKANAGAANLQDIPEEVLLDQNALAEGHTYCALGGLEVSPDHSKLAYLLDTDGGETYVLHVKDFQSGVLLKEAIPNIWGLLFARIGLAWAQDAQTLFYSTLDAAHRPYRLYRHRLGDDPAQDTLIYEESDALFSMSIVPSRSGAYLWVNLHTTSCSEVRCLPLAWQPGESSTSALKTIVARQPFVENEVEHQGDRFLIMTNEGAQNFRLMAALVSDPQRENWQEILPERADVTLEAVLAFQNDLVLIERKDGLRQVRLSAPDAISQVRYVSMPEAAYTLLPDQNPEAGTRTLRFIYSSLVTPRSVIDYEMAEGHWETVKQDVIPSGYDASFYQTERLYATAPDGQRVPISLVYRKGIQRNGQNPLLLYGYGSYGFSMDPNFNSNRLSLLDRGIIFALAHIRGGADLGRAWYEDGKLLKKKNTFTDFIACAEHLIAENYTCREKLGIMGGSAGGLLVGAVMTMRPDLCQAVVAQVPFVDIVSTMSDPTIPLTTAEYDQWGNPDDPQYFEYMISYSPYDNLRATAYPHVLLTTGLYDPRVAFWEPAKFCAKLRALKTNDNLVLLKTDFDVGHGGATGRYNALKDVALVYAFLLECLISATGLPNQQGGVQ